MHCLRVRPRIIFIPRGHNCLPADRGVSITTGLHPQQFDLCVALDGHSGPEDAMTCRLSLRSCQQIDSDLVEDSSPITCPKSVGLCWRAHRISQPILCQGWGEFASGVQISHPYLPGLERIWNRPCISVQFRLRWSTDCTNASKRDVELLAHIHGMGEKN